MTIDEMKLSLFYLLAATCYHDFAIAVLCPILLLDTYAAPFLSWRQLTWHDNHKTPSYCSSLESTVFSVPSQQVCIDPNRRNKPRKLPVKVERTLNLRNKPGKWFYPNSPKADLVTLDIYPDNNTYPWQRFHNQISKWKLYDADSNTVLEVIEAMKNLPVVNATELSDLGTWFKLFLTLSDGTVVLFKPQRLDRHNARQNPDTFYFADYERHNAEIAAFHIDKLLGFNWVPPTIGRVVNITRDVEAYAGERLKETIYISPVGNKCIHGNCDECRIFNAVCGQPEMLEGSFQLVLPEIELIEDTSIDYPYARTYWKRRDPPWLNDLEYCHQVEVDHHETRLLLDIMDIAVFDFLIGNQDRHHLHFYPHFVNESLPLMFDNGRSFGRPDFDDETILAPIEQCCLIRYRTLVKLMHYYESKPKKLSVAFAESSKDDLVYPLLTDDFLEALDRRVDIVIKKIETCIHSNKFHEVVIDDPIK